MQSAPAVMEGGASRCASCEAPAVLHCSHQGCSSSGGSCAACAIESLTRNGFYRDCAACSRKSYRGVLCANCRDGVAVCDGDCDTCLPLHTAKNGNVVCSRPMCAGTAQAVARLLAQYNPGPAHEQQLNRWLASRQEWALERHEELLMQDDPDNWSTSSSDGSASEPPEAVGGWSEEDAEGEDTQ